MAKLGVGILIIPQKPWEEHAKDLENYNGVFREVHGVDAPPPTWPAGYAATATRAAPRKWPANTSSATGARW